MLPSNESSRTEVSPRNDILIQVDFSPELHSLAYKNAQLTDGYLPPECFRDSEDPIHILPNDVDPSAPFSVAVNVLLVRCVWLIEVERPGAETN